VITLILIYVIGSWRIFIMLLKTPSSSLTRIVNKMLGTYQYR